jgi:D-alanyl-D-alanine carboxypeptidase/D-alanyl-D-alanine-endopeptidase (penicillin-binding protein 4)
MAELTSSLPITGMDGTLKRSQATVASAHLKTGSLREVMALAGYVQANSGKRYVLVALVNHPNAMAARPALDALVDWTVKDNSNP